MSIHQLLSNIFPCFLLVVSLSSSHMPVQTFMNVSIAAFSCRSFPYLFGRCYYFSQLYLSLLVSLRFHIFTFNLSKHIFFIIITSFNLLRLLFAFLLSSFTILVSCFFCNVFFGTYQILLFYHLSQLLSLFFHFSDVLLFSFIFSLSEWLLNFKVDLQCSHHCI